MPPLPTCEVCVAIPVRSEAHNLTATLHALAYQIYLFGQRFGHHRYEIMLLANNCDDDTVVVAHHFGRRHRSSARQRPPAGNASATVLPASSAG